MFASRCTCDMAAGHAWDTVQIMWTEVAGNIAPPSLYPRHACKVDSSSTSQACRRWSSAMALIASDACSHLSEKCPRQYWRLCCRYITGMWEPRFSSTKMRARIIISFKKRMTSGRLLLRCSFLGVFKESSPAGQEILNNDATLPTSPATCPYLETP